MKLTFRTITGQNFNVEADASTKVGELKAKVEEVKGADFPKDSMKLVYKGKVLEDEAKSISEYGVNEDGFLVVFIQKKAAPKPAAPAAPAPAATTSATPAPAAAPAATPPAPAAPAPAPAPAAASTPAAPAAAAAAAAAIDAAAAPAPGDVVTNAASVLASGSALESAVNSMVEMGFPREEVMRAMRAAYNNPDRACEYLMTGIPANAPGAAPPAAAAPAAQQAPAAAAAAAAAQPAAPAAAAPPQPFNMFAPGAQGGAGGAGAGGEGGALDFLRAHPQFQLLRRAVAANPNILIPMLQELGKSNPQLLQTINANQGEFMRLLGEAPGDEEMADMAEALAAAGGMAIEVELSEADEAAIARLEGLGFERGACIEAYLACDRNEEVAANFLLENGFE